MAHDSIDDAVSVAVPLREIIDSMVNDYGSRHKVTFNVISV